MKKIIPLTLSVLLLSAILLSPALAAGVKPVEIKKGDKCAVCGMLVSVYKNWVAEIVFRDGSYAAFDGPKDMFKYYLDMHKFNPSKKQSDIAGIFVTEYYSTKMMDAQGLFFVKGSDVNGPMGTELVPVASLEKAQTFMKDHRGRKIMRFSEVNMSELK
jgi:copper chaperone NosL